MQEGEPAEARSAKGEIKEDEEVPKEELKELDRAHRAEMERRKVENWAQNLKLAQKCREQANKIKSSGSRGWTAPRLASSIKGIQQLRAKQKVAQNQQQQDRGQKKPHRY